jgi:hypothetical protein
MENPVPISALSGVPSSPRSTFIQLNSLTSMIKPPGTVEEKPS